MLLMVALLACATPAKLMTASTVGAGGFELSGELSAIGAAAREGDTSGVIGAPVLALAGRYGVSDRVDLGGRVSNAGVELQSRVRFAGDNGSGAVYAFAPSVHAVGFGDVAIISAPLPLLIGLQHARGELVLAPQVIPSVAFSEGAPTFLLTAGAGVGYSAQLGANMRLMPEIAVQLPLVAASREGANSGVGDAIVVQAGCGITWGRRRSPSPD